MGFCMHPGLLVGQDSVLASFSSFFFFFFSPSNVLSRVFTSTGAEYLSMVMIWLLLLPIEIDVTLIIFSPWRSPS